MNKKQLRQLLITARSDKGQLSQDDVATLSESGITRQYYGMIENGEREPSVKVAKAISRVLGVEWTIFFEVDGNDGLHGEDGN